MKIMTWILPRGIRQFVASRWSRGSKQWVHRAPPAAKGWCGQQEACKRTFTGCRSGRFYGFSNVRLVTRGPMSGALGLTAGFVRVELGPGLLREVRASSGSRLRRSRNPGHPPYKAPYQYFHFVTRHSARPGLCPEPVFQNVTLFG
jgi:hypothetical protein